MSVPKSPQPLPRQRPGKEGGKRDENRRKQVAIIGSAALQLFCDKGVQAVTIGEIVKAAGVAKGSFYRYFESKTELVLALFAPIAAEIQSALQTAREEINVLTDANEMARVYSTLAATIAITITKNPKALQLYLQENRGPAIGARAPIVKLSRSIEKATLEMTLVAQDHDLLRKDYDAQIGSLASIGAIERILLALETGETDKNPAEVAAELIRIMLNGIR